MIGLSRKGKQTGSREVIVIVDRQGNQLPCSHTESSQRACRKHLWEGTTPRHESAT